MHIRVEFHSSAFNHKDEGVTKADILRAIDTFIYEDPMEVEDNDNQYLLLGFDRIGRLLEIMYNRIDEETIYVFHAMPCRKKWLHLIG
jgi:hypothetical protein